MAKQTIQRVEKPWGYELIWAKTKDYVGKVLHINKGHKLSLQYHRQKEETIFISSGKMNLIFENEKGELQEILLVPGEAHHIPVGRKHRMVALEDTDVCEVSTRNSMTWFVSRTATAALRCLLFILVIMAGGSGTRFWPKSTSRRPKQLLAFGASKTTLLGQTLERFDGIVPKNQRLIVTTELLEDAVHEQASGASVLAEPQGRNTAPCVYWAAREIAHRDPNAIMLVMPADHYMSKPESFRQTVNAAAEWAATHDDLVTLGVKPTRPETGYGYLKIADEMGPGCRKVEAFVEKPSLDRAQSFVSSGGYLWNGGMFIWRVSAILAAFDRFMPEMKKIWDESEGESPTRIQK